MIMEIWFGSAHRTLPTREEDVTGEADVAVTEAQTARLATVTGGRCVYATRRSGETIVP
jgi:hypothetical protein